MIIYPTKTIVIKINPLSSNKERIMHCDAVTCIYAGY